MSNMNYTLPSNFYPTPDWLADKMLSKISDEDISVCQCKFLEPSAGTGNLVEAILRRCGWVRRSEEEKEGHEPCNSGNSDRNWLKFGKQINIHCFEKDEILRFALSKQFRARIIGDDFLETPVYVAYDAIIMNPPFEDGDKHLLKALDIIKNGGVVVCLLNAETLKNPYTNTRRLLQRRLLEM